MKRALLCLGRVGLLLMSAVSLIAADPPETDSLSLTNLLDPQSLDQGALAQQLQGELEKGGVDTGSFLDEQFLLASMFWGSVAAGYLLYSRKQRAIPPFLGGVAMLGVSFFVSSWFWMSIACIVIMAGVYHLTKQGY